MNRKQFDICERINRARALNESVYCDTGSQLSEQIGNLLNQLFAEQFKILVKSNAAFPPR